MTLNTSQLQAIKYYEGDAHGNDPFWGDAKAYVTLNSLFYPGIDTERRRTAEGKRLNPAIVADYQRLFDLCVNLLSACYAADLSHPRIAYRVERHADYLEMREAGQTISFTSTSTAEFLPAYGDRIGIALLEFRIPAGVPCLPFGEVLRGDYAKSDEQEIMLPPDLPLAFEDAPIRPEENAIVDAQGNPPIAKCLVFAQEPEAASLRRPHADTEVDAHIDPEGTLAAMRVYKALNSGKEPDAKDVGLYCAWKNALARNVLSRRTLL